jgi:hypothetical protein
MDDMWAIGLFALFAIVAPVVGYYLPSRGLDGGMQASFAEQTIPVDDEEVPAGKLTVLYRSRTIREKYGCNASWICRGPRNAYLLAMVQGSRENGRGAMIYMWTWRRLTEERARHALVVDRAAYKAAFGD